MPLPLPVLDDRKYQDLLDELIERIPATAPAWTDYNASDPGITMLELFAYLSESLIYRLDRVPEREYRAFLRLTGVCPKVAQVARTVVAFTSSSAAGVVDLPAGVQMSSSESNVVFQTTAPLHVSEAKIVALLTATKGKLIDRTTTNEDTSASFQPLGDAPQVDDALYVGFDRPPGVDAACIRLFSLGDSAAGDLKTWQALHREYQRVRIDRTTSRCASSVARPAQHYGVRVAWEFYDGHGWQLLPALKDWTRALTLSGPVRWHSPAVGAHQPGGVAGYDSLYFIRCRVVAGAYDCPPTVRGLRLNAVIARHAADVGDPIALEGRGTGRAGQTFFLTRVPVVPRSTHLTLYRGTTELPDQWEERANFDRSGAHAPHYVLDSQTGQLSFGDGREGQVLGADLHLKAVWQVGAGADGDVAAGVLDTVPTEGVNQRVPGWTAIAASLGVLQPIGAYGGEDAESLDAAKARAYRRVIEERCAATLTDLANAALNTPGVPVARAYAVAEHHTDLHCLPATGCVTVVVVPRCVNSNPHPTSALCRAVESFIARRRPVALEVHVAGPRYTKVVVTATLVIANVADRASIIEQARTAISAFLDPLSGGPAHNGWPVGRAVYRSEVLALLDAINGVDYVAALTLTPDGGTPDHCGDISICADGLVLSGDHQIIAIEGTVS
jgi:predicted phage baseplate assembly protein